MIAQGKRIVAVRKHRAALGKSSNEILSLSSSNEKRAGVRSPTQAVSTRLVQAAMFVLFAASTRTRVIPAYFLADMKTHNVATLPCGVEENKKPRSSITSGCALPTLSTVGALQLSDIFESHVIEHH